MIKKIILLATLLSELQGLYAQSYIKIVPTPTGGTCGVNLHMEPHGLTTPFSNANWSNDRVYLSTGLHVEGLCDSTQIRAEITDINCRYAQTSMFIREDTSKQVMIDTLIIVPPSSPSSSDGSIEFRIKHVAPGYYRYFSSGGSGGMTTDSVFTGLPEDIYSYSIFNVDEGRYEFFVAVDLRSANPIPCVQFTHEVAVTPSDTVTGCNGTIELAASGGISTYFSYYISKPGNLYTGEVDTVNASSATPYANMLCAGPYFVDFYNYANTVWYREMVYVTDSSSSYNEWITDSISTTADTIIQMAVYNCDLDYDQPFDTVYISNIESIGAGQFEFTVSFVQSGDTTNVFAIAVADTNYAFVADVAVYCDDSTFLRSSNVRGSRNIILYSKPDITLGASSESTHLQYSLVFPNPASSVVHLSNDNDIRKIEFWSVEGQLVRSEIHTPQQAVNINGLKPGIYLLKCYHSGSSNSTSTMRMIKTN